MKLDLSRAKVRLLDLAHDFDLSDMPRQADECRVLARGPIFSAEFMPALKFGTEGAE